MRLTFWRARPDEKAAVEQAQRERDAVREQWPKVKRAAETMRRHGERNGFAEMIRAAMGVHK